MINLGKTYGKIRIIPKIFFCKLGPKLAAVSSIQYSFLVMMGFSGGNFPFGALRTFVHIFIKSQKS